MSEASESLRDSEESESLSHSEASESDSNGMMLVTIFSGQSMYPHKDLNIPENERGISLVNFPLSSPFPRDMFSWRMPDSNIQKYNYFPPIQSNIPILRDIELRRETRLTYTGRQQVHSQKQMAAYINSSGGYTIVTYQVNNTRHGVRFSKCVSYSYSIVNPRRRRYNHLPDDVPLHKYDDPPDVLESISTFDGEPYAIFPMNYNKIREILPPVVGGKTKRRNKKSRTRRRRL